MTDEQKIDEVRDFCDELERRGAERVVLRWIDEKRPVHHDDDEGMTIRKVTRTTVKTVIDGAVVEQTFEDLPYNQVRIICAGYDFETIERNKNLTR